LDESGFANAPPPGNLQKKPPFAGEDRLQLAQFDTATVKAPRGLD
jgi:hypothetical protein